MEEKGGATFMCKQKLKEKLKERLKEKLKETLKPKLTHNLKKRQNEPPQLTLMSHLHGNNSASKSMVLFGAANDPNRGPASDVLPLASLPEGAKIKTEQNINGSSPLHPLEKEVPGQAVQEIVRSLGVSGRAIGRKKAGSKAPKETRVNRFADNILHFVGDRSVSEKLIRGALGNNPDTSKAIRLLLTEKRLKRLGDGGKGCAYVYVRTDVMDNKEEPEVLHQLEGNARALTVEREFVLELGRRFPATRNWYEEPQFLATSKAMGLHTNYAQLIIKIAGREVDHVPALVEDTFKWMDKNTKLLEGEFDECPVGGEP